MRRPIFVLVLLFLLLTSCTGPTPTVVTERIADENLIGSIKQDAPCYRGPDPRFGIATKLKNDSQISIIGASEKGEYAVINDPYNSGKICWVDLSAVDISSDIVAKTFMDLAVDNPDLSLLDPEELLAEFMKLNMNDPEDPDNSEIFDMVLEFNIMVAYRCPDEWETRQAEESDDSDDSSAVGQAAHDVCTLGGLICHTYSTIDNSLTECGYLVFPVYYFQKIDCSDPSDCVTGTPPSVEFIPCTPTTNPPAPYILNLTLCWIGPGPEYEGVSSLEENTYVEVLGVGENSDYIVITNPRYNRPCWVKDSDIELDGLNVADMRIFEIPIQDDLPDSPEMGCMVASSPSAAPKCIKPCPDPVAYPVSCEP